MPVKIGIGLPNVLPGADGELLVEWARRAEERGFDFVSTVGRLAYPSHDDLISLAVCAGATRRIGLLTNVLLSPLIPEVLLAKSTLTLAHLSQGRLTLGVGLGARELDYVAAGRDYAQRAAIFDRQLETLCRAWRGEPVAEGHPVGQPAPGEGVPLIIGGYSTPAVRRTVEWGAGWTGATGGRDRNGPMIDAIRAAWRERGREAEPRFYGLSYFALDDGRADEARENVREYYSFFGEERSASIAKAVRTSPDELRAMLAEHEETGFTHVVLTPGLPTLDEVDRLADVIAR